MAVYTELSRLQVEQIVGICEGVGALVEYEGVAAGSINSVYRVTTEAGEFYLRINEGKGIRELVYERDLLGYLHRRQAALGEVVAPRLVKNVIGGVFFTIEARKHAMLFEALDGRELAVFEVEPAHAFEVGAYLARAHNALRAFPQRRANPYGWPVVECWLKNLGPARIDAAEKRALVERLDALRDERRPLPRGTIHGDLFINNTKWRRGHLSAVFDWEMAGRDHLLLDLAIALHAWAWQRAPDPGFSPAIATALVAGYQSVRPLHRSEIRGFFVEACFAALRFTVSRIKDFEVPRNGDVERQYLDYRDFLARLLAVEALGPRGFRTLVGLSSV